MESVKINQWEGIQTESIIIPARSIPELIVSYILGKWGFSFVDHCRSFTWSNQSGLNKLLKVKMYLLFIFLIPVPV